VPDQSVGEKFYRHFGLVDVPSRGDAVRLRPARVTREAVLLYPDSASGCIIWRSARPATRCRQSRESLARAGVREMNPPPGAPDGGVWIRDPDGPRRQYSPGRP
jgi:hypothetical protein